MQQKDLVRIRQRIWKSGMVFARIDRNPGRMVIMCRDLWADTQNTTFLQNDRYVAVGAMPSIDDSEYANNVRAFFLSPLKAKLRAFWNLNSFEVVSFIEKKSFFAS